MYIQQTAGLYEETQSYIYMYFVECSPLARETEVQSQI